MSKMSKKEREQMEWILNKLQVNIKIIHGSLDNLRDVANYLKVTVKKRTNL